MNTKQTILLAATAAVGFALNLANAFAAESPLLPFQGRLTDANGTAIADGARVVQFKIYDAPVGGQAVWNGEVQKLTVNAGMVNTLLGTKADLSRVDFNRTLYLETTLDADGNNEITPADPPLLPRQVILPAVFAKEAADSRKLAGWDWGSLLNTNDPVNGELSGDKLADGSLPASKITDGALPGSKISDGSITLLQLAQEVRNVLLPAGTVIAWAGAGNAQVPVPEGWLPADGRTIGNAGSGAAYAAESSRSLYQLLWASMANTELPIQNSDGSPGSRGASAVADFDAGKRLPVPDLRGRTSGGAGQGTALSNRVLGSRFGAESQILTTSQMPAHDHLLAADGAHERLTSANSIKYADGAPWQVDSGATSGYYVYWLTGTASTPSLGRSSTPGGGNPLSIVQPSLALTYLVKL